MSVRISISGRDSMEAFVFQMSIAPCNSIYCRANNLCWPCRARKMFGGPKPRKTRGHRADALILDEHPTAKGKIQ